MRIDGLVPVYKQDSPINFQLTATSKTSKSYNGLLELTLFVLYGDAFEPVLFQSVSLNGTAPFTLISSMHGQVQVEFNVANNVSSVGKSHNLNVAGTDEYSYIRLMVNPPTANTQSWKQKLQSSAYQKIITVSAYTV